MQYVFVAPINHQLVQCSVGIFFMQSNVLCSIFVLNNRHFDKLSQKLQILFRWLDHLDRLLELKLKFNRLKCNPGYSKILASLQNCFEKWEEAYCWQVSNSWDNMEFCSRQFLFYKLYFHFAITLSSKAHVVKTWKMFDF